MKSGDDAGDGKSGVRKPDNRSISRHLRGLEQQPLLHERKSPFLSPPNSICCTHSSDPLQQLSKSKSIDLSPDSSNQSLLSQENDKPISKISSFCSTEQKVGVVFPLNESHLITSFTETRITLSTPSLYILRFWVFFLSEILFRIDARSPKLRFLGDFCLGEGDAECGARKAASRIRAAALFGFRHGLFSGVVKSKRGVLLPSLEEKKQVFLQRFLGNEGF